MAKPLKNPNALTPKQEAFALEYVRLGVVHKAYRAAYKVDPETKDNSVYNSSSLLLKTPKIARRIKEIQESLAEVAMGELVAGLRQSRDIALEDRNSAAVNGAVLGLAKLKGYLKDDPTKAGDIHIHFDGLLKGVL